MLFKKYVFCMGFICVSSFAAAQDHEDDHDSLLSRDSLDVYYSAEEKGTMDPEDLGASVKIVKPSKLSLPRHRVILILSEPEPGSLFSQMGLREGDQIKSVGKQRTYDVPTLHLAIRMAKDKKGKTLIQIKRNLWKKYMPVSISL